MDNIDCAKFSNKNGISCYRNSILAILQNLPLFSEYLTNIDDFKNFYNNYKGDKIENTITYQLFKLFNTSFDNPNATLNPSSLNKIMGMKNEMWTELEQQDSTEYLLDLIDGLRSEHGKKVKFIGGRIVDKKMSLNKLDILKKIVVQRKKEDYCSEKYKFLTNMYSPFNHMFNFLISLNKKCNNCNYNSINVESSNMLKLDLINKNTTLFNLIEKYLSEEEFDDDNLITCKSCCKKTRMINYNKFESLPKILIINFKRFDMSMFGRKKTDFIDYPLELDLSKYVNDDKTYKYYLVGVNLHLGFSINHGHYISIVKLIQMNKWVLFDDSNTVREIDNHKMLVNNNSTILFYIKEN